MKKFKTSAEKRQLQEASLERLLDEKNLVRSSLVNYAQVPLGLVIAALTGLCARLAGLSLRSLDAVLLIWLGLGFIVFFFMLQAWEAFARHRSQLGHVRNAFAGRVWPPVLIGALLLYLASPLGLPSLGLAAGLIALALMLHLPLPGGALKRRGRLVEPVFLIYAAGVLALPLSLSRSANPAALGLIAVATLLLGALAFGLLGAKAKQALMLDAGPVKN